jgi:hypothetical protein
MGRRGDEVQNVGMDGEERGSYKEREARTGKGWTESGRRFGEESSSEKKEDGTEQKEGA